MGIPRIRQDVHISTNNQTVLDTEVDALGARLSWGGPGSPNSLGAPRSNNFNHEVMSASVTPIGAVVGKRVAATGLALDLVNRPTFPNGAEWGWNGTTTVIYYSRIDPLNFVEIWVVDPNFPGTGQLVLGTGPTGREDFWLNDAWRAPAGLRMLAFVRCPRNADPLVRGTHWTLDLATGRQTEIPHFVPYVPNLAGRAMRIVEEWPSVVFPRYLWRQSPPPRNPTNNKLLAPDSWQLVWQLLGPPGLLFANGQSYHGFGPVFPGGARAGDHHEVIGAGVRKMKANNFHVPQLTWRNGYFVYVLRRTKPLNQDFIDFYVFDFDANVPSNSRVLFEGSAPVPKLLGPGLLRYGGIGDDEPYEDPDDNSCIALALVEQPGVNNPAHDPGAIAVFTFRYGSIVGVGRPSTDPLVIPHQPQGPVAEPRDQPSVPGLSPWSFDMLSPFRADVAPRIDPEPLLLRPAGKVFLYNRQLNAQKKWELHRTLAFE